MDGADEGVGDWVVIHWETDEFRAGVVRATLEGAGITARVVTDDPTGTSGFFGAAGSRRVAVLVREGDEARARAALEAHREESADVDWDQIDVGEPDDDLARRITAGRPRGWWWGGWPAAVVLLVGGFLLAPFSARAASLLWLAALIGALGSGISWLAWRVRSRRSG